VLVLRAKHLDNKQMILVIFFAKSHKITRRSGEFCLLRREDYQQAIIISVFSCRNQKLRKEFFLHMGFVNLNTISSTVTGFFTQNCFFIFRWRKKEERRRKPFD
jgi:hypothetical protein